MKIYTIGHISPDLDTVVSAIEYADFLTTLGRYGDAKIIPLTPESINKETEVVLKEFGAETPLSIDHIEIAEEDRFILVDHNEDSQRSSKVQNDKIIEVVDHHKPNINFGNAIRITTEPVGCTGTIIYNLYKRYNVTLTRDIAGLILSAIISDTISLQSPTTTKEDTLVAKAISTEFGIDMDKLTYRIFESKADLSGLSAEDIVSKDYKVFEFGNKKVFIGQVETVDPQKVLEQKDSLVTALTALRADQKVDHAYLFITDILKLKSVAVYVNEEDQNVIEKAFNSKGDKNVIDVGNNISRKKNIAPALESVIK